jgi:hypothetical protein
MQNLIERLGIGESTGALMLWIGLGVLLLVVFVALATWLVRTLRPTLNLSGSSGRGGRPQRLAITDAFTLDRDGRKLVIIRRDNVEHLLLIGGPNDVVVEQNIVRNERAIRGRSGADADALQAVEAALSGDTPLAAPSPPPAMVAPPPAPRASTPPPPPRPPANPISQPAATQGSTPRLDDEFERALSAMQQQVVQRQQPAPAPRTPAPEPTPAPAMAQRPAPAMAPRPAPPPPAPVMPAPPAPVAPPPAPPPLPAPPPSSAAPASPRSEPMSEMARRLNEVLQKPISGSLRPPFNKPIPPVPPVSQQQPRPMPPPPPPTPMAPEPAAGPAAPKPAPAPAASDMDMLEEEMARLLGRPGESRKPDPT